MGEYKVLDGLDVSGKRVLVRVDYNVKVKKGKVEDDTRIRESLETINYLIKNNAKIILMAHFGRPQEELESGKSLEEAKKDSSLAPVVAHLGDLISKEVRLAPDCVGSEVESIVNGMEDGSVVMLENLRLHEGEGKNDPIFIESLAKLADIYVFDGFGVAHRAHASSFGVPLYLIEQNKPAVAGFLMDKELKLWEEARKKEGYKLLVIGGAKLKEKTNAAGKLYKSVDAVLIGGAIYNIVMAGKGIDVGSSMVAEKSNDYTGKGKELVENASNLVLADKVVIAKKEDYSDIKAIEIKDGVPEGYIIADIVVDDKIREDIAKAQVVMWFGNIGISDIEVNGEFPFAKGTDDFKNAINKDAYVIIGGGDSITASEGIPNKVISTGGGASIQLYTKGTLEALEALRGNKDYLKK
ncbi:MAG: phosphoglycerate kinase [Nanoarchaeota archaeon]|nr:phosphoglycerate kinase [Nanoarchaeota archaeon]